MLCRGVREVYRIFRPVPSSAKLCCVASSWASCKLDARYLPHEANVAQVFSRAGNLSDPNIDPEFLAHLVMVSVNKKAFQPSIEAIKKKYYELYRGKGGAGEGDEGAADGDAEVREGEAGPSSAGQK